MGSNGMRTNNEVMFTDGGLMVIHPSYDYYYHYYYDDIDYAQGDTGMGRRSGDDDQRINQTLYMIDLSDPGNPVLLPQYIFPTYSIYNMMCMGNTVFFTEMEYVGDYDSGDYYAPQKIRYQLGRIDLTNPEEPVRKGGVNIPGTLLGVSAGEEVIYTLSRWYLEEAEGYVYVQTINALEISDGFAYLRSAVVEEDAIRRSQVKRFSPGEIASRRDRTSAPSPSRISTVAVEDSTPSPTQREMRAPAGRFSPKNKAWPVDR